MKVSKAAPRREIRFKNGEPTLTYYMNPRYTVKKSGFYEVCEWMMHEQVEELPIVGGGKFIVHENGTYTFG